MIPGFIMWLLGVPLVVIILLFVFRVIEPSRAAFVVSLWQQHDACGSSAHATPPLSPQFP